MTETISAPPGAGVTEGAGISRRRIVQGAAWVTPAIVIAAAAPAAATSLEPDTGALVATLGAYSPNPGNSNQRITTTVARSGGTQPITLSRTVVRFIKNGGQQASSAQVLTPGWGVDGNASRFPSNNGEEGVAVFVAQAATVATLASPGAATQVEFNLNRFAAISRVRVEGTSGATPVSFEFTPAAH